MPGSDGADANHLQYLLVQGQQTQGVGHGRTGLAHPLGSLLLGQAEIIHQGLVAQGFFHAVQVLPLQVFNQRQLLGGFVICLDDKGGNLSKSCQAGGAPAAFPRNNLIIPVAGFPDGEGLNHAMNADGFCQRLQLLLIKILTGLVGVWLHPVQGQLLKGAVLGSGVGKIPQQRAKASA